MQKGAGHTHLERALRNFTQKINAVPGKKLSSPKCQEIINSFGKLRSEFPTGIDKNAFLGHGYVYEEEMNYRIETES